MDRTNHRRLLYRERSSRAEVPRRRRQKERGSRRRGGGRGEARTARTHMSMLGQLNLVWRERRAVLLRSRTFRSPACPPGERESTRRSAALIYFRGLSKQPLLFSRARTCLSRRDEPSTVCRRVFVVAAKLYERRANWSSFFLTSRQKSSFLRVSPERADPSRGEE